VPLGLHNLHLDLADWLSLPSIMGPKCEQSYSGRIEKRDGKISHQNIFNHAYVRARKADERISKSASNCH
jgi:hypothetical protein